MNQTNKNTSIKKRPIAITLVSIYGIIASLASFYLVFSETSDRCNEWLGVYQIIAVLIGFICFVGLWNMQRWAIYTFYSITIVNQLVFAGLGAWSPFRLFIPFCIMVVLVAYRFEME